VTLARLRPGREVVWLAVLIALVLLAALPVLSYPLGRDQGEFATIGRGLLQGRLPYVDLWNPKPPAVFQVYAAAIALFGQTAPAIRAIDLVLAPLMLAPMFLVGRRLGGSAWVGLAGAALLAAFYFTETFWTLTQNDGIALAPMLWALACALKAADAPRRSWPWALLTGILCGYVFWYKYPFALFAPMCAVAYAAYAPRIRPPDVLAVLGGGLTVLGGGAWLLAQADALDALIESARVTSAYAALGLNVPDLAEALGLAIGYRWAHWGLLFALAAIGVIAVRRRGRLAGVLLAWLGLTTVIMLSQAKAYDYHWLPMLPPLALLGALGLRALADRLPVNMQRLSLPVITGALLALIAANTWGRALPYLTGAQTQAAYYRTFQAGEFVADESQAAVDFLTARVLPGDSLYIWGFRPEIYFLSRLNPPTRFIFQFPLVADWYPEAWREENVDILWAALPPYVLVAQVDYMPWVTGSEEDSNTLLQSYEELNDWLIYNYEPETQIGNLFVWRRKS
jgi:4-amino-4-deoxy-L-arabinose transferase-like glycosyltransferase